MNNKRYTIPIGMVTKKYYCHKCGERLYKFAKTRIVKPGDPDYRKHNKISNGTRMIGEVEVTEYDFKCPICESIVSFAEQELISSIQKNLAKNTLTDEEIQGNLAKAKKAKSKKENLKKVVFVTLSLLFIAFIFYLKMRSGELSFTFYF
ncbi:MAG: hypothetical protein IKB02_08145 [Clostridia bacterium]|nr:hypothetical protein [Clostridia bacterium]